METLQANHRVLDLRRAGFQKELLLAEGCWPVLNLCSKTSLSDLRNALPGSDIQKISESAWVGQEFEEGAFLWMPLSCAKRAKPRGVSELPNAHAGRSTAFQQVLWKTRSSSISTNPKVRRAFIMVSLSRDP